MERPLVGDLPRETIGRYEIRREIGRGMMGVVYEALDPALARTIALKTIKLSFSVGADDLDVFEQRFFAEARIAARLSHPGIVVVYDVGRDAQTGTLYIAMERLRGRTLAELISDGVVLDWRTGLSIVVRIAEALHHAHAHGVVHRDLKPANIMLLPSGEPKILDFGIAKVETARTKLTSDGQFFGTPLYMSPEQAQGKDLDARSDLFSLGAVAYNLLTGHAAFAAESITAIIQRVIEDEPLPPSRFVRDLPKGVDLLIARALAKEPADRYPDGHSLAEDIEILGGPLPEDLSAALPSSLFEGLTSEPPHGGGLRDHPHPPVGVATHPGGDLEDELETLVSGLILLHEGDVPASPPSVPGAAEPTEVASESPRWLLILPLALVAVLVALGSLAYVLWSAFTPSALPPTLARPSPSPPPIPATPTPAPSAAAVRSRPLAASGLAIDFQYPLKDGRLSVWIDGKLSLDQDLASRTAKKIVGIKVHEGSLERTLAVRPGRHEVRVQVAWDDNVKEETLAATFKAGVTRQMEIRLGRIRKNLSVEWK
jgi:serine/threonine protein kinase